ncbi:hypothetical protein MtrunA17_Chr7g0232191 [Medicago truncatula]|uniref:Uncharacterized protein n=1 Tax=Medicago truncatula TaxID=3880 RepID=A0A396GYG5_MEDTR|nr:hypothetical protein MtrunA17_Chr7g0232191 [Medicago truncatula]
MPIDKKNLKVLVECSLDFESIKRNSLVKDSWVREEFYDEEAPKMEKWVKIAENPSLKGKTRKQTGLEDFKKTEIRSAVMGIRTTITREVIVKAAKCSNTSKFQLNVKKNNPWIKKINETLHKVRPTDKTLDLLDEHRVLHKLILECFMPRDGGSEYRSVEYNLFLHFIINHQKVNLLKYMFNYM